MKRILVLDLEASCWEDNNNPPEGEKSEIIEIGAVILEAPDGRWEEMDAFSLLIRPSYSTISEFCENLTGISQKAVVDFGMTFEDAMDTIGEAGKFIAWASWGQYDYDRLRQTCKDYNLKYWKYLPSTHLNVKSLYSAKYIKGGRGLGRAIQELGWGFEGTPHSGKDDAINTSKILRHIIGD